MSSIAGLSGWGDIHYSTAKGGLLGFVRAVARSCGPLGIRANAVCPGVIDAGMTDPIPRSLIEPMRAMTPLGTYGTADDIANACLYLASDESGFVTGQWLSPNGGLVIG
jgi:3-oxoacyl-[acyl-carrier protein] reductase